MVGVGGGVVGGVRAESRRRQWRARGERRRRMARRYHKVRRGRWIRRITRIVERVGLVKRWSWDAKSKRSVQKGVGG